MAERFLIDSNVVLDIVTRDPEWYAWSAAVVLECGLAGELVINPIVYAELAAGFSQIEDLDEQVAGFGRMDLPWAAGFAAGRAFREYRSRGGERRSPLPDFYIGAHAALLGMTLVTRDRRRLAGAFPTLRILAPAAS